MERTELNLPLIPHRDVKAPKETAIVHLRVLFRPGFLVRTRKSTSTFSNAGGAVLGGVGALGSGVGAVGSAGIRGAGAVGGGVIHAGGAVGKGALGGVSQVGKGVGGIFKKGNHTRRASQSDVANSPVAASSLTPLDGEVEVLAQSSPMTNSGQVTPPSQTSQVGTLSISINSLEGSDHEDSKCVIVKSGSKVLKETKAHKGDVMSIQYNETAVVKTQEGPMDLSFSVV